MCKTPWGPMISDIRNHIGFTKHGNLQPQCSPELLGPSWHQGGWLPHTERRWCLQHFTSSSYTNWLPDQQQTQTADSCSSQGRRLAPPKQIKTAPSMLQHPSLDHFSTGRSLDFVPTILCPEWLTIQNPEIDTAVGRTPRHFVWWKRGKNEKIGGSKIKDDQGPKLLWMRPVFHTPKISLLHVATIATTSLTKLQIRFRGTLFYNQL